MKNNRRNGICDLQLSGSDFRKAYGRAKRLATLTLGCKVNQYETQALTEIFEQAGYETVSVEEPADVFVINTCTVTSMSDRKSRQMIRRTRKLNPQAVVAVTGCYAQLSPEEVRKLEGVQVIAGTSERHRLIDAVQAVTPDQESPILLVKPHQAGESFEALSVKTTRDKTRAYVKIQDGCNQYCSYCIIPYARGPVRSRPEIQVVEEVKNLVANGYQEVVLTGIHLASYGKDWQRSQALIELLGTLDAVKGLRRLRLGSLEPTLMQESFVRSLGNLKTLCPHFHLSLQSGSDRILKAMNRRYDTSDYQKAVGNIRDVFPQAAITTDLIVGFPGETEEEFEETLAFVNHIKFADIHVFRYSPREGTPAARFENQVPEAVKNQRSQRLTKAAEMMKRRYHDQFVGQTVEVLVEQQSAEEPEWMEGHSPEYLRVLLPWEKDKLHRMVRVRINESNQEICRGVTIDPVTDQ